MQCQGGRVGIIKLLRFSPLAIYIPCADSVDYLFS